MGGGFVRAEGTVLGRVGDNISVEVPRMEFKLISGDDELFETYVNFFDFSIKIFKKYRNMDFDCVIIEDVKECVLFGCRLPISIKRIYGQPISEMAVVRNDGELVQIAHSRLSKLRAVVLSDSQLLKMRTYGEFT